jgi:hypothetical protein
MPWQIKVDDNDAPVFQEKDGNMLPVYIDPDGQELALDPPSMYQKIADMGKNNQADRKKYTQLRDQFKIFGDIEDLEGWKKEADKALQTVQNLQDKDLIDAKKVDDLKRDINAAWEEKLRLKDTAIADLQKEHSGVIENLNGKIRKLLVSNKFASSKFFNGAEKITVMRADVGEAYFGQFFNVEEVDGEPVVRAYYDRAHENLVTSKLNPGEPADFEEALGMIIDRDPDKETLLRSTSGGSGGRGGSGGDETGSSKIKKTRAATCRCPETRRRQSDDHNTE